MCARQCSDAFSQKRHLRRRPGATKTASAPCWSARRGYRPRDPPTAPTGQCGGRPVAFSVVAPRSTLSLIQPGGSWTGPPLLHTCCEPSKACVDQGSVFRATRLTSDKPTRAGTSYPPTLLLPHRMSKPAHSHLPDWRQSKWPVWWFNTCSALLESSLTEGVAPLTTVILLHTPLVSTPLASRVLYGNGGGQG